ncbi:MAG: outer membrane beta-barrel protein [Gemmatimonadales bacterium]
MILVGMLATASTARAQGAEFSLGGGLSIPSGTFSDGSKTGWHGLAAVSFVPTGSPVGIQIDGAYNQFKSKVTGSDAKLQLISGTANAVYKFKTSEGSRFRPYLIGGGGVYNAKPKNPTGTSQTKFGFNAGAGFDIKAGGVGLFAESRFHDVFTDGPNLKYIPITVGVRLGGH